MTEEKSRNASDAEVPHTLTSHPGINVDPKKSKPKAETLKGEAQTVESTPVPFAPETLQPRAVINAGPLRIMTKDIHSRLVQYLGISNPGVVRTMLDMLLDNEQKMLKFFEGAGIKFE